MPEKEEEVLDRLTEKSREVSRIYEKLTKDLNESIDLLKKEIEEEKGTKREVKKLREEVSEKREAADKLSSDLKNKIELIRDLNRSVEERNVVIQKLKSYSDEADMLLIKLNKEIEFMKEDRDRKLEQFIELKKTFDEVKEKYTKSHNIIKTLHDQVNERAALLMKLSNEAAMAKKRAEEAETTYKEKFNEIKNTISRLEEAVVLKNKMVLKLGSDVDSLKKKVGEIEKENQELKTKNDELSKHLVEQSNKLNQKERMFTDAVGRIRDEAKIEVKRILSKDAREMLKLKAEMTRLQFDNKKLREILREKELREKEIISDLNKKFGQLRSISLNPEEIEQIIPAIDNALQQGASVESIKKSLVSSGYSEENIDTAIRRLKTGV